MQKLIIVGGGSAGWMAASYISRHLPQLDIEVIASQAIPTIGVGEATLPGIKDFYRILGLTDQQVIQQTQATVKLGIQFENWRQLDTTFFHPFGLYGQAQSNLEFQHCWLKCYQQQPQKHALANYSLATQMAMHNKFIADSHKISQQYPAQWSTYDYALHFDANLFAKLLQQQAQSSGVSFTQGQIEAVTLLDNGQINQLVLQDGSVKQADFYIDCSGFAAELIGKALNSQWLDWSEHLPCDKAIVVQSEKLAKPPLYTRSIAQPAGWQWQIPLQHRVGNGYVFSSLHLSDEQAQQQLLNTLPSKALEAPRIIKFNTGVCKTPWLKNCLAIGLAAGFVEPLESTSLSMIETALARFLRLFPSNVTQPQSYQTLAEEYNRRSIIEAKRIRDFIQLHYLLSQRQDSPFWLNNRNRPISPELANKISLFKQFGEISQYDWESFSSASWLSIYIGMGLIPQSYSSLADRIPTDVLNSRLSQLSHHIYQVAQSLPNYH